MLLTARPRHAKIQQGHRVYIKYLRFEVDFLNEAVAYLAFSIAEDDSLRDRQRIVEITECVKLPFLSLYRYKELLDAF